MKKQNNHILVIISTIFICILLCLLIQPVQAIL